MENIFNKDRPVYDAAKRLLSDAGFDKDKSIFTKRVAEGLVKLAELFDSQNYSTLCGRLVVALFSRIARGNPPTVEFLQEVCTEIEKVAEDFPYSEDDERMRWLRQRYPVINWAGDLHKHVKDMAPPLKKTYKEKDVEVFSGAPLYRTEFLDGYSSRGDEIRSDTSVDDILIQTRKVTISELKELISKDKRIAAIKLYKDATGNGLKESRDFIYALADKMKAAIVFENDDCNKHTSIVDTSINDRKEDNMDITNKTCSIVKELCRGLESFTSLDVSNKVKSDGVVVRHREVAECVRQCFATGEMKVYGYVRELIDVTMSNGANVQTYLYHHTTIPAEDYKNRSQIALRPKSNDSPCNTVDDNQPQQVSPVVQNNVQTPPHAIDVSSMTRTQKGDGRLEVPHAWMSKLGWNVGDNVVAVKSGNGLVLKTDVIPGETVVKLFNVDRWHRIRITTKVLSETGIHFGTGGQHVMTLRTNDIKID